MDTKDFSKAKGHWILARMGKRVLRPGGKELTDKLMTVLQISPGDDIVEFAPGLGYTASRALAYHPQSYVGIDADEDAVALLSRTFASRNASFVKANAEQTGLPAGSKDKVYGEAMLTMQSDAQKSKIIREAHRILKPGGLYGIHELGLCPEDLDEDLGTEIRQELARVIRVNARPRTSSQWKALLEAEGFTVKWSATNSMRLLESRRILDDEGFLRVLKINFNILIHPRARRRILEMRRVFRKYEKHMNAVALIAEKN